MWQRSSARADPERAAANALTQRPRQRDKPARGKAPSPAARAGSPCAASCRGRWRASASPPWRPKPVPLKRPTTGQAEHARRPACAKPEPKTVCVDAAPTGSALRPLARVDLGVERVVQIHAADIGKRHATISRDQRRRREQSAPGKRIPASALVQTVGRLETRPSRSASASVMRRAAGAPSSARARSPAPPACRDSARQHIPSVGLDLQVIGDRLFECSARICAGNPASSKSAASRRGRSARGNGCATRCRCWRRCRQALPAGRVALEPRAVPGDHLMQIDRLVEGPKLRRRLVGDARDLQRGAQLQLWDADPLAAQKLEPLARQLELHRRMADVVADADVAAERIGGRAARQARSARRSA